MNYSLFAAFLLSTSIIHAATTSSSALPPDAVKVSKENNPNCVEYYNYKGTMYCSLMTVKAKPFDRQLLTYEKQNIEFDSRVWQPVWGEHKDIITSIEYLPAGQNINHWHELITSQFLPGFSEMSAKEFVNHFLENLDKSGISYSSKILEKQGKVVIFEFQVKQPKNLQQDELQKVVKGADGMYVLHYAIKQTDMGESNRKKWLKHLQNSTLKN